MTKAIVHSLAAITLVGAGRVSPSALRLAAKIAPAIVAADGGADRALAAGFLPEAVIGDLDSLGSAARAAIPADRIHRIDEQDSTDFEKALGCIAAPFVLALGFSGPRIDHGLATWNALVRVAAPPCLVLGGADLVFALPPGRTVALDLRPGTRLSLFPMARLRGRATGLRWPVDGIDFAPDGRVGTSNRALGPVTLRFDDPGMLTILPRSALGAAIAALAPQTRAAPRGPAHARGG